MGRAAPYFITSAEKGTGKDDVLDYVEQINKTVSVNPSH